MLIPIGFFGAGGASGPYELISTTLITTSTAGLSFTSIPSSYKHLQIRYVARNATSGTRDELSVRFNGSTAYNHAYHKLQGNGSSVASSATTTTDVMNGGWMTGPSETANVFGAGVIDILDYASTSKNKTIRSLSGLNGPSGGPYVSLNSGFFYANTNAITSIQLNTINVFNFAAGSRFSLYGIKG
jgi:hypothetical protein